MRSEKICIVYDQAWPAFLGGVAATLIFVWIFNGAIRLEILVPWTLAQLFVYAARAALSVAFKRRSNIDAVGAWAQAHLAGTLLMASLWGAIWILFVDADESLYVAVAMLRTLGLGASAVGAYSVHFPTFMAFYIPVVLPAFVYILAAGGTINTGISLGLTVHAIVLMGAMTRINHSVVESIRLNFALGVEIDERLNVERQLRELSQLDGLTGLANRRHFDDTLDLECVVHFVTNGRFHGSSSMSTTSRASMTVTATLRATIASCG